MKIWLITIGEPLPTDLPMQRLLRTGVLARSLVDQGHQVIWFTSAFDHTKKIFRSNHDALIEDNGLSIHLMKGTGYKRNISLARLIDHMQIARRFREIAPKLDRPELILTSYPTPELCLEAVKYANKHGVPIIVDVRDIWPNAFINLFPSFSIIFKLLLSWMYRIAGRVFQNADGIIAVDESYLDYGLTFTKRGKKDTDKVIPLGYPEIPSDIEHPDDNFIKQFKINQNTKVIWYIGSLGHSYDLDPLIFSAKKCLEEGKENYLYIICGVGEKLSTWKEKSVGLTNIIFTGWVDLSQIAYLRTKASIGVQAYSSVASQSLANKLYDYISNGIPILSSLKGENALMINQYNIGKTYDLTIAEDFHEKLTTILENNEMLKEMGDNASQLYKDQFSHQLHQQKFISYLESFTHGYGKE